MRPRQKERPCPPLLVGPQSCSELQAAVDEGIVPGGGAALSLPRLSAISKAEKGHCLTS